jgi:hypothetical protein
MKVYVSFAALEFRQHLPYDQREAIFDMPEQSTVRDAVGLISERVGMDVQGLLRSKKVVLMFRNRMTNLERDGKVELVDGDRFVFINPLIGG